MSAVYVKREYDCKPCFYFFFTKTQQPLLGQGLLIIEDSCSHSVRLLWTSDQPDAPDNTHHSQETNIHSPGGIRTHNLTRRAAANPRLMPRDHWIGVLILNS